VKQDKSHVDPGYGDNYCIASKGLDWK